MSNEANSRIEGALDRQKQAWLAGRRPDVEELLRDSSARLDSDDLLDLIYHEIVLREEMGEIPSLGEYVTRYPHLDEDLKLHFEVHQALKENGILETGNNNDADSLPEPLQPPSECVPEFADYEVVGELGRGGMGIVYKAKHLRLRRYVALKMFRPGRTPSAREIERFRSEAASIARLQHPNIVQIFEVSEERGEPFLALELAEKGTLQQKLQDMPYAPRAAAELVATLANAIHHAHEHHIVHRDLKPANVLFARNGVPKITDFGLAKLMEPEPDVEHDVTRTGEPIGTPRYMSPEQTGVGSDPIGPATDIYALGTVLYECMTGRAPFVSASIVETMNKIRHDEPVAPRRLQRSIPRDLEIICLRCLHKTPSRRYASAQALADDLRHFLQGEPIKARPTPLWERAWMWRRRHPVIATSLAASFLSTIAALIVFGIGHLQERERVAALQLEVAALMSDGQKAMSQGEGRLAEERFQTALSKIQSEPALYDSELGVRGWLDHSHRLAEQQRMKQRNPPPLFDERRDEAFVQSVLVDASDAELARSAHDAITMALKFTIADDPAWHFEREGLFILDADLMRREGNVGGALALLCSGETLSTRPSYRLRADLLSRLDMPVEAERDRQQIAHLAPSNALDPLFRGLDHFHEQKFDIAVRDFDDALAKEPDHLLARFLQAICLLHMNRPTEAKVGLTACIGQRPRFMWAPLYRSQAYLQLGDMIAAAQDLQSVSEMNSSKLSRQVQAEAMRALGESIASMPKEGHEQFWNAEIAGAEGRRRVRDIPAFQMLK